MVINPSEKVEPRFVFKGVAVESRTPESKYQNYLRFTGWPWTGHQGCRLCFRL